VSTKQWRGPLALAAGIVCVLVLTGWTALQPNEPLSFNSDHLLTLGNARSYMDGHGFRWNDRLGFPAQRDQMYHATFYLAQKSIMWIAARVVRSPAAVVYVFYGVALALVFCAAYWGLRRAGVARDLAWLGGVAFAVTPYIAIRAGLHDMLSMPFSVPAGAVLALWVAQPETLGMSEPAGRWRRALPWMLAAIVGASGLYYAFFASFFVMVLATWSSVTRRTLSPFVLGGLACAAIVFVMLVTGPGLGLIDVLDGRVTLPSRVANEQAIYGLALGDAFKVVTSWPALDGVAAAPIGQEGDWGEWPGVVLTMVILILPFVALWRAWLTRTGRPPRTSSLTVLCGVAVAAGVLFTLRGGPGLWFNELVTPAIRAQNRVTPYLTYFAIAALVVWVDRVRSRGGPVARAVWAGGLAAALLVSAWPALRFFPAKQRAFLADGFEQADRQSLQQLVGAIGTSGVTTVLQVPVAGWPEAPVVRGIHPERFELPYILTPARSIVRWSYGLSTRQPEFNGLTALVDGHLDQGLAQAAAFVGFDAVLIEKAALSDADLRTVVDTLSRGRPAGCRLYDDRYRALFQIGPTAGRPECAVEPSGRRRYVTTSRRYGRFLMREGWSLPETDKVWTDGPRARMALPIQDKVQTAKPSTIGLTFGLYRPDPSRRKDVTFVVNGREVGRLTLLPGERAPASIVRTLPFVPDPASPRRVIIEILIGDPERPADYGASDTRRLGLALFEVDVG
jgi:hypothetical protein